MNKVFRDKKLAIKILSAISAAAIITGGIAFYLSICYTVKVHAKCVKAVVFPNPL